MLIFDVTCPSCGAKYQVAASDSLSGGARQFECQLCAETADRWDDTRLRVHRLIAPPNDASLHVPTKPLPLV